MARDLDPQCKKCRRLGNKLFLKGERCFSPKCAITKRNYPPGVHGPKGQVRLSEYGGQLKEKQKLKNMYGVLEKQFQKYFFKAFKKKGNTGQELIKFLETRLDNVIYRLGLAVSRRQARQLISHGLFKINKHEVDIPSYQVKIGDIIELTQEKSLKKGVVAEALSKINKKELPEWLAFNEKEHKAKIIKMPSDKDLDIGIDIKLVVEFYSR